VESNEIESPASRRCVSLLGLEPLYQQITLGALLLAAVALDSLARRGGG
jgi:ABC-type xylose transport system permease subunit